MMDINSDFKTQRNVSYPLWAGFSLSVIFLFAFTEVGLEAPTQSINQLTRTHKSEHTQESSSALEEELFELFA